MSKTKDLRSADPTYVDEVLTKQVATIMLTGASPAECAKQLAITPAAVRKITASDTYKDLISEVADESLAPALAKAKAQIAKLTTKAVLALEKALDEGGHREALQAATIVLKSVGLHEEGEKKQDTNVTVILPGASNEPVTYEVPSDASDN